MLLPALVAVFPRTDPGVGFKDFREPALVFETTVGGKRSVEQLDDFLFTLNTHKRNSATISGRNMLDKRCFDYFIPFSFFLSLCYTKNQGEKDLCPKQ
jgi:hypothetical protein